MKEVKTILAMCELYVHINAPLSPLLLFCHCCHIFIHLYFRIRGNTEARAPGSHQSPENSSKQTPPPPRQNASLIPRKPSKSPLCHPRRHALRLTPKLCPTRTYTRLFSHALALLVVRAVWKHLEEQDFESKMVAA